MALVVQALCLKKLGRVPQAEAAYREAIAIYERTQGGSGRDLAVALDNLASLYMENGRLDEAEQLRRRAIDIFKSVLKPNHPSIATALANLAVLYQFQGRHAEAEATFIQALEVTEKAFGADSRSAGIIADNLAGLYRSQRQFDKAEPLYRRALEHLEKSLGPEHPDTALALQNYAILLGEMGERGKAEESLRRALTIAERLYGSSHENVAAALNTLGLQYIEQKRWREALDVTRRAAAISVDLMHRGKRSGPSEVGQSSSSFRRLVQAAFEADATDTALSNEAFIAAQRALETRASAALQQLAARFAAGDPGLAKLIRERQDLVQQAAQHDKLLIAAVAKQPSARDAQGEAALKSRVADFSARLDAIDEQLAAEFPGYAGLDKPEPLDITGVQALLSPDEVLVQFIDLQEIGEVAEVGFGWFITKSQARWVRLPIGTARLERTVAALRCGLDATNWTDASSWPEGTRDEQKLKKEQTRRRDRCASLTGAESSDQVAAPFDLDTAHGLYDALFGQAADLLLRPDGSGMKMLVVPTGPLTKLPMQVLVTEKPAGQGDYAGAAWLAKRHAVTVLPSVAALKALRHNAQSSRGTLPIVAFGNPLLVGRDGKDKSAYAKQSCPEKRLEPETERVASALPFGTANLLRGGQADVDLLRRQTPLPETADEICAVAQELGADQHDIHLGADATETRLKLLSNDGTLGQARVVHFATHGLVASETQSVERGLFEPALLLTPPATAVDLDDGLLTASEITQLKLDTDWVVLSACNTAAGNENADAEPLSGLARAFFYAGARALLVSHWYVDSHAAARITTGAFKELARDPTIGRAEALRRAMMATLSDTSRPSSWTPAAHPSVWAPFVIVGEGGSVPASAVPEPVPTAAAPIVEPDASSDVSTAVEPTAASDGASSPASEAHQVEPSPPEPAPAPALTDSPPVMAPAAPPDAAELPATEPATEGEPGGPAASGPAAEPAAAAVAPPIETPPPSADVAPAPQPAQPPAGEAGASAAAAPAAAPTSGPAAGTAPTPAGAAPGVPGDQATQVPPKAKKKKKKAKPKSDWDWLLSP